jgi:uncharacterized membrane protein
MVHRSLEHPVDKKLWPIALWLWLLWIVVLGLGIWAYPRLPSLVPVHFSATGRVNGVMPKGLVVTVMPAIIGALMVVWSVLWRLDPHRQIMRSFGKHTGLLVPWEFSYSA